MNTNKLIGMMAEKGFSQRKLAEEIGMSKNTLNLKLNGKSYFNTEEATKICGILGITDKEMRAEIFLP